MKRTPEDPASEQTTSPSPIIKKYFQEKMQKLGLSWAKLSARFVS